MSKYFIEEVKCDWSKGFGACPVISSIKYRDSEGIKYLTIHEIEGFLSFFVTDDEKIDLLVGYGEFEYDEDSDEYAEADCMVNGGGLEVFDGIVLAEEKDGVIEYIEELDDGTNMTAKLLRYGLSLIDCSPEELDNLIKAGTGKAIEDLEYDYEFDF